MVKLICKSCGSQELRRGSYYWTFVCLSCGKSLELWNVEYTEEEDKKKELPIKMGATLQVI